MNALSPAQANSSFWSELCGTSLARRIGVTDSSPESLRKFDDWYFGLYPYLARHVAFADVAGERVLEVGLGYGSVAQRLAEAGAVYQGLDIASGPVAMVNQRLRQAALPGSAVQGNILSCPFPDGSFDRVIAIGCYHHTGDLPRAIAETHRVLRKGGRAMIMVYNAYSYRRWIRWPISTASYFMWDKTGLGRPRLATTAERKAYDADSAGNAAPETVFVSVDHLRRLAASWRSIEIFRENIGGESFLRFVPRALLLRAAGPFAGLDLYCHLVK